MNFGYVYDHCPEYSYLSMETVAIFPGFKIENRSFSLHCPDFIRGPIPLRQWCDLSEIWRRDS